MASQPIASTAITSFSFDSFIRGYHAYMDNQVYIYIVCKKMGGAGRNARSQRNNLAVFIWSHGDQVFRSVDTYTTDSTLEQ